MTYSLSPVVCDELSRFASFWLLFGDCLCVGLDVTILFVFKGFDTGVVLTEVLDKRHERLGLQSLPQILYEVVKAHNVLVSLVWSVL